MSSLTIYNIMDYIYFRTRFISIEIEIGS